MPKGDAEHKTRNLERSLDSTGELARRYAKRFRVTTYSLSAFVRKETLMRFTSSRFSIARSF